MGLLSDFWSDFWSEVGHREELLVFLSFLSQSNDSADMGKPNDGFKFVDELTVLQIINLLLIQITSYDILKHLPSDTPTHNGYIDKEKLQSQKNLSLINSWTIKKKIILNKKQQQKTTT